MTKPITNQFGDPFAAQLAALRLRLGTLVPTARWDDLTRAEHDRAFVVAGAVKADLLADLAAAVDRSVAEGTTYTQFEKDFRALVEKHGWHGWTGEGTAGGEAWRMRTIYRTNIATSYASGRMAQLIDGKFKYWVYRHGNALEPRLQHLAWDGVALPPDHPFWAAHAPPNGWGCTCYVNGTNSDAGIRRVGGVPGKNLPSGWDAIDPRTGAPDGIDKGWDYSPGASAVGDIMPELAVKVETMPDPIARALIDSLAQSDAFARWLVAPTGIWPIAKVAESEALAAARSVAVVTADSAVGLAQADLVLVQKTIDRATRRISQDANTVFFIGDIADDQKQVMIVKVIVQDGRPVVAATRRVARADAETDIAVIDLMLRGQK